MKIFLSTLEDITFNNLMPWLEINSDVEHFDEILRAIDIYTIEDHKIFFRHLIEMQDTTGSLITNTNLHEWKDFTNIRRNSKIESLTNQLLTLSQRDAKVNFYTNLITHSVSAIMSSLQGQMAIFTGIPLKKQFVDKYVIRLKRIIEADIPCDDHSEDDLLIIKFTKLGALSIYMLLLREYKKLMNLYNELTHNDIMAVFAGISMADKELAKTASALMQVYVDFVKSSQQPSPTNKLKEAKQQAAMKTGGQGVTPQEKQTSPDQRISENQNTANNDSDEKRKEADEKYLNSKEVMEMLKIDKSTLWRYRNDPENKIPHYQQGKGKKIYYEAGEIEEWLKNNPKLTQKST